MVGLCPVMPDLLLVASRLMHIGNKRYLNDSSYIICHVLASCIKSRAYNKRDQTLCPEYGGPRSTDVYHPLPDIS